MDEKLEAGGGVYDKAAAQLDNGARVGGAEDKTLSGGVEEDRAVGGAESPGVGGSQLDAVMRWADRCGSYERLLVWAWVAPVCLLAPCAYMNILLMVYLPPSLCSLPPAPDGLSHDAWRNLTTPRGARDDLSSCTMYDFPTAVNWTKDDHLHGDLQQEYRAAAEVWAAHHPHSPPTNFTTECIFGYDFDDAYFEETAATQFEWACGDAHAIQMVLHASILGNLFGCVIYGALADKVGRRKVFVVLAMKVAVFGSLYVFLRPIWVVLAVRCLVSTGLPVFYQIVIISALEQVSDQRRGLVTSLSSVFFSLGQCLLAPLAWLTSNWVTLGLVTSLPALLALLYLRVIEESPRWLVSRGRFEDAASVLRRIAKMNHLQVSHQDVLAKLHKACDSCQKQQTFQGLLEILKLGIRYPRLASRTTLITVCWTVNLILYYTTTMKYPYVFENPFLGWFSISVMEVPANILVLLLLKKIGRRPLHAIIMAISAVSLLSATALLAFGFEEKETTVALLVLLTKFCTSMTFLVTYLQAAELHPTPVRTCATGFASLVAISCNVSSPSITNMARPWHSYLLLGTLGLIGVLSAACLPETAGRPLPQTLEDAENFGRSTSPAGEPGTPKAGSPRQLESLGTSPPVLEPGPVLTDVVRETTTM